VALWAGHDGSLLFWTWIITSFSALVVYQNRKKNRELMPYVISLPEDVKDIDELIQKRPDDWKDRAAHPQEFFAVQLAILKGLMKKDLTIFEQKLHELVGILGSAPELKQGILAKQFADTLGLSEQGILAAIQKTVPPTYIRDELKQRQSALSTSEYVLALVLLFPLVTLVMEKTTVALSYFPLKEQQELFQLMSEFAKKHEHIVLSVLDKKTKKIKVTWETVYTRFTNEVALEFSRWIAEISGKNTEITALIERIGLSEMAASIVITDEVILDFFKAWTRLKRQCVALRMEVLRKRLAAAEMELSEPDMLSIQGEIQENMEILKKIEKQS